MVTQSDRRKAIKPRNIAAEVLPPDETTPIDARDKATTVTRGVHRLPNQHAHQVHAPID